ncbi:MAG: class I SAM-dependent methyltransferase [Elusimicrobia bacterium]|nr:class I SAM-dependent methyltransferase [Elusimicrobiota bacterium]
MDYRERIYSRYRSTHIKDVSPLTLEGLRYEARVFRKVFGPLLPSDKNAAIFELGCGSGSFLYFLGESGYKNVAGLEQDPEHVVAARRFGVAEAACGDALKHLSGVRERYDCVIAIDVVEHFKKEELFGLLDSVMGALKPGGVFVWRAPNADGLFAGRLRYGDLTHEISFTKSSAWQLMAAADFADVEISPEEPVVTGVRSAARVILWNLFKIALKAYLFAESYAHGECLLTPNLIVRGRKP